jgi:hypothetical protein
MGHLFSVIFKPMQPAAYGRLKYLFHEALELDGQARDEFLSRLETTEPEIATEVRSLVDHHELPGEFLDPAVVSIDTTPREAGNYRIERELGAGGSGRVFLAVRKDDEFGRPVAGFGAA